MDATLLFHLLDPLPLKVSPQVRKPDRVHEV